MGFIFFFSIFVILFLDAVVGCNKLKDTEWISRQDPYAIVEYGSNKSRTRTCTGMLSFGF